MKKYTLYIIALLMTVLSLFGCGKNTAEAPPSSGSTPAATSTASASSDSAGPASGKVNVYVLDIGQGDSILIDVGGKYSLIDTGDVDHRDALVAQLKKYNVHELENVILTHPHADHIGGFVAVAKNFKVNHVYDNGLPIESSVYHTYLKTLQKQHIPQSQLYKGDRLDLGHGAYFEVYAPWKNDPLKEKNGKIDQNNNSIVGKFVFGKFSMLFTGDAEKEEEARLIKEQNTKMSSKVLKVGHHGSNGSSTSDFLRSVRANDAIISCGLHNSYGHPGQKSMDRILKEKMKIYRTDTMGTVHIETDGNAYNIMTER